MIDIIGSLAVLAALGYAAKIQAKKKSEAGLSPQLDPIEERLHLRFDSMDHPQWVPYTIDSGVHNPQGSEERTSKVGWLQQLRPFHGPVRRGARDDDTSQAELRVKHYRQDRQEGLATHRKFDQMIRYEAAVKHWGADSELAKYYERNIKGWDNPHRPKSTVHYPRDPQHQQRFSTIK